MIKYLIPAESSKVKRHAAIFCLGPKGSRPIGTHGVFMDGLASRSCFRKPDGPIKLSEIDYHLRNKLAAMQGGLAAGNTGPNESFFSVTSAARLESL